MKKHIFVLLSSVLLGGMCGCVQKSSSAQYMTFDTVDYVDGFPCVVELTESKEPEFDVITRVRDKDCVKNRVKRAKIVRFTLC